MMDTPLNNPACKKCELGQTAKKVCIPGRGSEKPRVMFVGQAPGREEDLSGRCFVGPAGRKLTDAIRRFDLRPAYITNAAKCFPPRDRDPKRAEIESCREYLDAEIDHYKPEFIVALGNVVTKALVGKTGITTWSGSVVGEYRGAKVFALLHPSYILRTPRDEAKWDAHLRALSLLLRPQEKVEGPTVFEVEPADLESWLRLCERPIAFDFETTGKFKWEGGRLRSVGFSVGNDAVWINYEKHGRDARRVIREWLLSDQPKVVHNSPFEYKWCLDEFGVAPRKLLWDTFALHHLVDENKSHALDAVVSEVFQVPTWDIAGRMAENGWTYETVPIDEVGPYNALDAYWTARLVDPLLVRLRKWGPGLESHYRNVVLPGAFVCARMERRGIKVDVNWCKTVDQKYADEMAGIEKKMREFKQVKTLDFRMNQKGRALNFNSQPQMQELFYDILKFPTIETTEAGKPSCKESALKKLETRHPVVPLYLKWKERQTGRNNFLQKFPRFADKRSLIRPSVNPFFVVTGRLSVTNPPFQAVPEDPAIRGMVVSRWVGGKVASLDYKQLEVRLVAGESGESGLLAAIDRGDDLHDHTARLMFGAQFEGKEHCAACHRLRSIAKRLNFAIVYGISAYAIEREFSMTPEEANAVLQRFRDAYPAIYTWMHKQYAKVDRDYWIANNFGRVRRFPELRNKAGLPEWRVEALHREAGNFPIASMGADLCNLAMVLVDKHLRKNKFKSKLVLQWHDALVIDTHPDELDSVPARCAVVMGPVVQKRCPWLKVNLAVDVSVTDRLGGMNATP